MNKIEEQILGKLHGQKRYSHAAQNIEIYTHHLIQHNLPPLLDVNYLAEFVGVPANFLGVAMAKPELFYRSFFIPKRRGGKRLVEAPIPSLLFSQRWIVKNLLDDIPVHSCATAYRKGIGLIENVKPHAGQTHLLKLDLKDFFHSITINRVISVFRNLGYLPEISYALASICCLHGRLPQGAATSPTLSNIIAKRLDLRLSAIAAQNDLQYTRYSDDLTFSGNKIPSSLLSFISNVIRDEGFKLNSEKTRLYHSPGKRIVTGISVRDKKLKLPKNTKRAIRQDFFEFQKMSQQPNFFEKFNADVFFLESLKGRLAFWAYIEPDSKYPFNALESLKMFATQYDQKNYLEAL